jgi:hypothetical protein
MGIFLAFVLLAQSFGGFFPSYPIPVPCAQGGTGLTSFTVGDLIVANGSCGFAKISDVALGSALVSGGVGAAPAYTSSPAFLGSITAGSGSVASCVSGDGCFARSTTTGGISLGGSSKACVFDYNVTLTNFLTIPCSKAQITASSGNATIQINDIGAGNATLQISAVTGLVAQTMQVTTSVTPSPGPRAFGTIDFDDLAYGGVQTMGALQGGITDHGDGTHGGFFLINTTSYAASPIAIEAIQVTPGGHVGFPGAVFQAAVTSPSSCTALTTCGTYTWTFAYPFIDNAGNAQNPVCLSPSIEDTSITSAVWVGNVVGGTESSTSVQFNYAPLLATVAPHTLTLTMTCYQGVF